MQVAGDDALYPLVDLNDASTGTGVERTADRKTKKDSGKQTKRQRPNQDTCDLPDFIDVSSDYQHVAIRQFSCDQADCLFLPATPVRPLDYSGLRRIIGLKVRWQALQVTSDPVAV